LDPSKYHWPDEAPGEGHLAAERKSTFDHVVNPSPTEGFENIVPTPFGNELLVEMALAAVEGENLGSRNAPDLLCVSFSSTDAAGHIFGPYSQEEQDILLRLDLQLADFFTRLDKKLGIENVAVVLTADHGVAPTPEFASQQGLDGEREDLSAETGALLQKLEERFGAGKYLLSPRMYDGQLYLNHAALNERRISAEEVSIFIRDWALSSGHFQMAYTRNQILDGRVPGPMGQRVINGFHAERSGDVVLVSKPYHIPKNPGIGTTHGSLYSYDTHIPVLFYGRIFKPGRYADDFAITDLAPTLCAALHMNEPSGSIGKPLVKLIADQPVTKGR
jgi:predicted AlkP superfamily pyrophosphatase or phosphodiesterase